MDLISFIDSNFCTCTYFLRMWYLYSVRTLTLITSYGYTRTQYGCDNWTTYGWYLLCMVRIWVYTWYGHSYITHRTDIDLQCTDMIYRQCTDIDALRGTDVNQTCYGHHSSIHLTDIHKPGTDVITWQHTDDTCFAWYGCEGALDTDMVTLNILRTLTYCVRMWQLNNIRMILVMHGTDLGIYLIRT